MDYLMLWDGRGVLFDPLSPETLHRRRDNRELCLKVISC